MIARVGTFQVIGVTQLARNPCVSRTQEGSLTTGPLRAPALVGHEQKSYSSQACKSVRVYMHAHTHTSVWFCDFGQRITHIHTHTHLLFGFVILDRGLHTHTHNLLFGFVILDTHKHAHIAVWFSDFGQRITLTVQTCLPVH